ncbi:HGxxPAAW family protein [Streptomyces sp. S.PNR 29]|uniref:HGxxPAAW family protein n=1 Tax=Streptomyces sp. S.PNR 29 TaxID=2973805 RepID=UPI0025AF4E44|nr:HGxxPAAW family protein [Streptomyces sp. S.PNR 29]MDN0199439.1 hypothetical protein [Streptomyces sp. S.PNR 29]
MSAHQYDHGHTVAGWVGTAIASVGSVVVGLGVVAPSGVLVAGGLGICGVGLLVTWALHLAGWGKGPGLRPREEWGMRARDLGARAGHAECLGCRLAGRGARRTAGVSLTMPAQATGPAGEPERAAAAAD